MGQISVEKSASPGSDLSGNQQSVARVSTRVAGGGHAVDAAKLIARFPRTQDAVANALPVADAALLVDNSRTPEDAFTLCRIQLGSCLLFDLRVGGDAVPLAIRVWLDRVAPAHPGALDGP